MPELATLFDHVGILVIDEAHCLRNSGTRLSQAVASSQVSRRLFLTATPVSNGLEDLGRLLALAAPEAPELQRMWELIGAIVTARADCCDTDANMALLKQLTSKYLLARADSVHEQLLPPKVEQVVFVPLREDEQRLYQTVLAKQFDASVKAAAFRRLHELQQIMADPASSKMQYLLRFIRSLDDGDQVVVVSSRLCVLDALETAATEQNWGVLRLDGSTDADARMERVLTWNSNPTYKLFLLAKDAGAVGISLTAANWLVVYEPSWNATSDVQASGRIWRPGQTRVCRILSLIGLATVEEKVLLRQYLKRGCWPLVYPAVSSADEPLAHILEALLVHVCVASTLNPFLLKALNPKPKTCGQASQGVRVSCEDNVASHWR